uniref:Bifunctional inhibitor/plant lipid transfer protein/seed storage helical domain-containing protein n=1 Tax=Vitis vinifera TaxID=29760 RepID=A5C2B9_VITVI|nr:hypothetical protein VITISV_040680 [Vitis vinifera]
MGKLGLATCLLILLNLATLLTSLARPYPPYPTPPKPANKTHPLLTLPDKHPPYVKPAHTPKPPKPPVVKPPKPPVVKPPYVPKPPVVKSPVIPKPPPTCPIDTLKLGACVDLLGGLVHVGIGSSAKDTCCPVLQGLVDSDSALCLCTTIKAKLLNVNIIIPIALQVLVDCGKTPPPGFQCPA